mmetsp:Transcript_26375/g.26623  ORF Transcript_26375/g.26623 Transcript_26375/m.26623 type:complete len:246 (+) Transcript_26375:108-845(+)
MRTTRRKLRILVMLFVLVFTHSISSARIYFPNIRLFWSHSNSSIAETMNKYDKRQINHKFPGFLSYRKSSSVEPTVSDDAPDETFDFLSHELIIGFGEEDFKKANKLLLQFRMINSLPWISFKRSPHATSPIKEGENIGILVKAYHVLWILSPGRVTSVDREVRRARLLLSEVVFSTLEGHLITGEERFRVRKLSNGIVKFEIASFSKGSGVLGSLAMPFIRPLQRKFLLDATRNMRTLINDSYD